MCGLLRFFVCPGAWCVIVCVPHVLKEKACSLLLEHDVRYMSLASIHSVTLWFWEEASPRRVNAASSDNFPAPDRAKGVPSVVWLRGTCSKMLPLSPPCSVARPICLGQALICRHCGWPWAGNGEASLTSAFQQCLSWAGLERLWDFQNKGSSVRTKGGWWHRGWHTFVLGLGAFWCFASYLNTAVDNTKFKGGILKRGQNSLTQKEKDKKKCISTLKSGGKMNEL